MPPRRTAPGFSSILAIAWVASTSACDDDSRREPGASSTAQPAPAAPSAPFAPPKLLFLPDAGDEAPPEAPLLDPTPTEQPLAGRTRCPPEMVLVAHRYCIDRYEIQLVDTGAGRPLSPYYHPEPSHLRSNYQRWLKRGPLSETALGRKLSVPSPPGWQLLETFGIRAASSAGVVPSGYLNQNKALNACENAGKRPCSRDEWVTACKGQDGTKFPYGDSFVAGRCNVFRSAHPAALLHGNASMHHLDPRLNLTQVQGSPLLRRTGSTRSCVSRWGEDAVYDMVGNLDEWIADPGGTFVGGFFARATKEGCDASVSSHPPEYYDYSLGARCCKTP